MLKKQGRTADDNLELDPNVTPVVASILRSANEISPFQK